MGYAFMTSACCACGVVFSYNPMRVPSVRDSHGIREPVCKLCIEGANAVRKERGLEPFSIMSGAYEPCDEAELP